MSTIDYKISRMTWRGNPPASVIERYMGVVQSDAAWYQGQVSLIIDQRPTYWDWRLKMGFYVVLRGKVKAGSFDEAEAMIRSEIREAFKGLGI